MSQGLDFADEIAQEMRSKNQPRTWRKVTTVLSGYGRYKLTQDARAEIETAFANAGLDCVPSMMVVDRAASIRLTLRELSSATVSSVGMEGSLTGVTLWEHTGATWSPTSSHSSAGAQLAVDIDLSLVADVAVVGRLLPGRLDGFTEKMLQDLVTPDVHAKFKEKSGEVRRASLFVVASNADEAVSPDKAIPLSLRLVEFALGPDWIVIARHPSQIYVSGSPAEGMHAVGTAAAYMATLRDCGLNEATSVQGVALAIITQGVDSFSRTRAGLASYLESWRTDFASGSLDKTVLIDLQATLPLVVDALEPLLHPSVSAWVKSTWAKEAAPLGDQMIRSLDALHGLQGTTAAAIAQADQAQNEKYQRSLATLAAVFLAPALVASVFGANQLLQDSSLDLLWLFVAMVLTGVVTQIGISRAFRSRRTTPPKPQAVPMAPLGPSLTSRRRSSDGHTRSDPSPTPSGPIPVPPGA